MIDGMLWRAETLKTRTILRGFHLVMGAGMLVFLLIFILLSTGQSASEGTGQLQLAFPVTIYSIIAQAYEALLFAAVILATQLLEIEYRNGSWKMILPRRKSRWPFMYVKLGHLVLAVIAVLALILPLAQGMGVLVAWLQQSPTVAAVPASLIPYEVLVGDPWRYLNAAPSFSMLLSYSTQLALLLVVVGIEVIFWAVVAMLLMVLLRSSLAVFLLVLLAYGLQARLGLLSVLLPSTHLRYAVSRIGMIGDPSQILPTQPELAISILYGLFGLLLGVGVLRFLFARQPIVV